MVLQSFKFPLKAFILCVMGYKIGSEPFSLFEAFILSF